MRNNHYVPRFLTSRWEFGERRLWYYDFSTGKIRWASSEKLLAKKGLWSDRAEDFLNKRFETPVAKYLALCDSRHGGQLVDDRDQSIIRALMNLILISANRFGIGLGSLDAEAFIEKLPELPEREWARGDLLHHALYRLVSFKLPPGQHLFFPSTGAFFLPFKIPGMAMSVSPNSCVALISKQIPMDEVRRFCDTRGALVEHSVGKTAHTSKVIVPPSEAIFDQDRRRLEERIPGMRKRVAERLDSAVDLQKWREELSPDFSTKAVVDLVENEALAETPSRLVVETEWL